MAVDLSQDLASVSTSAQDVTALRQVFETITADSCPTEFNFHLHTVCSDGRLQPEELIQQAIAIGLQGLAITDHHTIKGYQRVKHWLAENTLPHVSFPQVWTGIEINAGLLGDEVHILAYAFNPDHEALQRYMQRQSTGGEFYQARRVVECIHAAGGLAVLAHPARYRQSHFDLIPAAADAGVDGIETYYAYNNPNPWHPSPRQTQEVRELGDRYGLLHTCGTDTHGTNLLQRL